MRRLSIEISTEQHQQIKAMAAMKGQSIKDFVIDKVLPQSGEEDVWKDLKNFMQKRMKEAKNAEPITSSFMEIFEQRIQEK